MVTRAPQNAQKHPIIDSSFTAQRSTDPTILDRTENPALRPHIPEYTYSHE